MFLYKFQLRILLLDIYLKFSGIQASHMQVNKNTAASLLEMLDSRTQIEKRLKSIKRCSELEKANSDNSKERYFFRFSAKFLQFSANF